MNIFLPPFVVIILAFTMFSDTDLNNFKETLNLNMYGLLIIKFCFDYVQTVLTNFV